MVMPGPYCAVTTCYDSLSRSNNDKLGGTQTVVWYINGEELLFCLESFKYLTSDCLIMLASRYIVDSIDAVARTIVPRQQPVGLTKKDLRGQLPVTEAFLFSTVISLSLRPQLLRALTWISSVEVLIKAPRAGHQAAILRPGPRSVLLHQPTQAFFGPFRINHVCLCCHT